MVRVLAIIALVAATCTEQPRVLRPNDATEFRIDVTVHPLEARAPECESQPTPGSRPCRVRFSMTVENIGQETADAICHFAILNPGGGVVGGGDFIIGTLEPGQATTRSGSMGFRDRLGRLGERRCASYETGSTADYG
jgi:hypothetical protein